MTDDIQQSQEENDTIALLRCAFPEGLQAEDYYPLLFALNQHETASYRSVAMSVTRFLNGHYNVVTDHLKVKVQPEYLSDDDVYPLIMSDLYGISKPTYKDQAALQRVLSSLKSCGYDDWLLTS